MAISPVAWYMIQAQQKKMLQAQQQQLANQGVQASQMPQMNVPQSQIKFGIQQGKKPFGGAPVVYTPFNPSQPSGPYMSGRTGMRHGLQSSKNRFPTLGQQGRQGGLTTGPKGGALPPVQLGSHQGGGSGVPNFMDQLGVAAGNDYQNLKSAEDARFAGATKALNQYGDFVEGLPDQLMQMAGGDINPQWKEQDLTNFDAQSAEAMGVMGQATQTAQASQQRVGAGAERMRQFAGGAVAAVGNALADFGKNTDAALSAGVQAATTQLKEAQAQIDAGFDPVTGEPLTPAQQAQARAELAGSVNRAAGETYAQMRQQADTIKAQLGVQLGQTQLAAAGVEGQATGMEMQAASMTMGAQQAEAGFRASIAERRQQFTEQDRMAFNQFNQANAQFNKQMRVAVATAAMQLQAEGYDRLAEFYRSHAYNPVAQTDVLLQMAAVQSIPGVQSMQGVNVPGIT